MKSIQKLDRSQKRERKLNAELELKIKELEFANRELDAFSYSVSHDLRAPLRAINQFSSILAEEYSNKLGEDWKRVISHIFSNSVKMNKLIDDLLKFSRMGRKKLVKSEVDMNLLVNTVLQEIKTDIGTIKARIKVKDLPMVTGDLALLKQVMRNLLSNAIKYSSKVEHPEIEIDCKEKKEEYVFCVRDNGAGFSMKYADKLFQVFQRLHTDLEFEGTGVGLAMVKRIIERHNGKVWAKAKIGEGAIFFFSLPKNNGEKS